MSHHISAKKRIESGLAVLGGQYGDRLTLGEFSKLTGVGIGTPPGHYPLNVDLGEPYGSDQYYKERDVVAAAMRNIGWQEIGDPQPNPFVSPSAVVFYVRPNVVQHIIDGGLELKGREHFTSPAQQPAVSL
jgi:hypothetical protein